jgi:hypothetical protein
MGRDWLPLAPQLRLTQQVEEGERKLWWEYGRCTQLYTRSRRGECGEALTSA